MSTKDVDVGNTETPKDLLEQHKTPAALLAGASGTASMHSLTNMTSMAQAIVSSRDDIKTAASPPAQSTKQNAGVNNEPSVAGTTKADTVAAKRRIIAEDPEWNLAPVERLSELCVKVIVQNFKEKPFLKGIPEKYKDKIIEQVSIDIPLNIAAPLIPYESYWQRRGKVRFRLNNVQDHGGSWRQSYFELHLQDRIESYLPQKDEDIYGPTDAMSKLLDDVKVGAPFVKRIEVKQLRSNDQSIGLKPGNSTVTAGVTSEVQPAIKVANQLPIGTTLESTHLREDVSGGMTGSLQPPNTIPQEYLNQSAEFQKKIKSSDQHLDHINLAQVFVHLTHLQELSIYYGVKDCGINFSWAYFGMTLNDCVRLSEYLKVSNLSKLTVRASAVDDDKCRVLCHALLLNTTLTHLDLSHNKIGDSGACGLAKVISAPQTVMSVLHLSNNSIGLTGAQSMGKSLTVNTSLRQLDLRLNRLGDGGGHALCTSLVKNKTVTEVDISGNGLGVRSVTALCELLKRNGEALTQLDISCNKLGNHSHSVIMEGSASGGSAVTNPTATLTDPSADHAGLPLANATNDVNSFGIVHNGSESDLVGKMIFEAISLNKYITKLDLRMTDLSPKFLIAIQGIVNENVIS
ncbi:hypothetical protein BATDEDRAFT_87058 [Batrachochytrium dendrobatidis JAM81]|uniref:Uncharacterized protein n=1 Tax=Batrachochytrium dendrobatidis (strain JAM81 / FGSC 10211) TaxID=684364 RepID=F4NY84_BATDJ|nr:uncharacterized protein BATDEDRAFT_87058 [Batrachochytrium dendrobatidis JAM81]EGF81973.1 hypothetical protein BATDEDRAFT_87058 [Batrachochytrium dendrobatidis JAM81]KAK5670586.1 hypothetical protein QVD99_002372 [Batrachochytrium dendrobatidis]|eukprot:XP_006677590.1 hypothetical protein BATDEDRAFT_87058 [Batrachochytrium dendrobatidis JAM81]